MDPRTLLDSLPAHLRPFVCRQDPDRYTPRDHAVWRFMLRHLTRQLAAHAHPVYLEGLARTGISLDHIPSIEEMNAALAELGWRAVVVDGFIPPAIFMEFQALRILVIALDMRSADQILYTPAPDIVHESAGHAPFIVDIDYAEFLQRFGEIGMRAIATREDHAQYEAVRRLSILKGNPDTPAAAIAEAEAELSALAASAGPPSEAALLTRLHWWTVEYGLVGDVDDYRIFGAGLLSSLGESRHCLDDAAVRKLPLTVDAVRTPYDITREQPQLFVTASCRHLSQVLEEFAGAMCFRRGGLSSLRTAIDAGSVCTARYDSGVQVSGVFTAAISDAVGNPVYLRTAGPTQLGFRDREIIGHGARQHRDGFGSPIGHLKNFSRCLSAYTIDELKAHRIVVGEYVTLEYLSGITVRGRLLGIHRQEHRNLLLSFADCRVTDREGEALFESHQGNYHLAVGAAIDSVYGGVADREALQLYAPPPQTATTRPPTDSALMRAYELVDRLRRAADSETGELPLAQLRAALDAHPRDWLLRLEMLGLGTPALRARLQRELRAQLPDLPTLAPLIEADLAAA